MRKMIFSIMHFILYPLLRYLAARFTAAVKQLSPPPEVSAAAAVSSTSSSERETKDANPERDSDPAPGVEENPPLTSQNDGEETVSGPMSEDEMGKTPERRDEEIKILHGVALVENATDGGDIPSPDDFGPEQALQTQFACLNTENDEEASTSPEQKEIQTSVESAASTDDVPPQVQVPVVEPSQTAAEPVETERWDEYRFSDVLEAGDGVNCLKPVSPPTESGRVAQSDGVNPAVVWRVWEDVGEDAAAAPDPNRTTFTVMSYNILAQSRVNHFPAFYRRCPPHVLDWRYRRSLLLREIQQWLPDILCLQEVQVNHYHEDLQPVLSQMGYTCVFKQRTYHFPDGCATCYRGGRFSELAATRLEFFRPETRFLNSHNVGIVLLLRPLAARGSGPPLCVANTHLLFNPKRGDVKLAQLAIMLAEIDRMSKFCKSGGERCNVVLCGDFNAIPDTPLYRLITTGYLFYSGLPSGLVSGRGEELSRLHTLKVPLWPSSLGISNSCQYVPGRKEEEKPEQKSGQLQYDHDFMLSLRFCPAACVRPQGLEMIPGVSDNTPDPSRGNPTYRESFGPAVSHGLNLESALKHRPDQRPPLVSTLNSRIGGVVDYIFYSPERSGDGGESEGLKLTGVLPLLSEDVLRSMNGLPNHQFPSDHLSLVARFQLDMNAG